MSTRVWIAVGGIGCVFIALVVTAGALAVFLGLSLGKAFVECVPSDFPRYAGAVSGGSSISPGTPNCVSTDLTFDGAQKVYDYFEHKLSGGQGNWTITQSDPANYRLTFSHARGKPITGQWWFVDRGGFNAFCAYFDKQPKSAFIAAEGMAAEQPVCATPG